MTDTTELKGLPAGLSVADSVDITATRLWLENVVIELNLCPFAGRAWLENQVLLASLQGNEEECLVVLIELLEWMLVNPLPDTVLLVLPDGFKDFDVYLDLLALAEDLCSDRNLDQDFQLASFHPDYCFEGASSNDASNYTNRSPYPLLHVLREKSVTRAVDSVDNIHDIPQLNVELTRAMGLSKMQDLLQKCYPD